MHIASEGFRLGVLNVPRFILNEGDFICLHWPTSPAVNEEYMLRDALYLRHQKSPSERKQVIIVSDIPRLSNSFFARLFQKKRVLDVLSSFYGISREVCADILLGEHVDLDLDYFSANLTWRTEISLKLAFKLGDVVVFAISGLDPSGVDRICDLVKFNIQQSKSAIQISYPTTPNRVCCSHARCLLVEEI